MKMAKKLLALLIAVMMVLSCGITSFAADEDTFADDLATARAFIDNLTVKSSTNIPSTITSTFGQQFSWDNEKRESANKGYLFEWSYYNGVVFEGLEYLYDYNSDETYREYVEDYMSAMIAEDGTWAKTTNNSSKDAAGYVDYHGADCYKTASLLIDMAKDANGVVDKTSKYYKMATTLYNDLTKGTGSGYTDSSIGGNYWHSNWNSSTPPDYRLWIDGIYMIQPFLAEYAYYAEDEAQLNAIADRFEWLYENDRNATSGLYYHGLNSKTSYVPYHWSRAIGWYAMAVVDVMQYMDGENLETMKVILKDLVDNMLKVQDSTGMWSNLCDQPITSTNRLETSGSSMMAYTIAKGVNNGWLDESYGEFAKKAFSGIVDNKLSTGSLTDIYFKGSANGSDNYNNASNYYTNEGKGVGPFIMAYAQVLELFENETAVEKPLVKLLTLSDYQKWSSNWTDDWAALQTQLNALVNGASGAGVDPDYMLFGGDYTCLDGADLANTGMGQVYSIIQSKWPQLTDDKILNIQGNHDAADFDGYCETGAYYYDNYIVYLINEDDYPSKQNGKAEETIVRATTADLEAWLDEQIEKKETRPILIATHTGLHYDIDRADGNNQFASILFDAVNEAAKQLDIVFFFGHNHTNGDEQQGGSVNFFPKGSSLNVCTTTSIANKSGTPMTLNFTYMNYGYIGYVGSITNQPTEITPTDILTISELSFYGDRIEVKRYSANGLESAYNETITIKNYPEWVEAEKYDITYKLNNGEADKVDTVVVGENKIDTAVPEREGFNFICWTTKEDGTGDSYNPGDKITVSENITLYAQWEEVVAPETNGAQYTLVDTITPGKQYIMVWNSNIADNSGIKYALTANGAAVTTTVIDEDSFIAEDTILIPYDVDASAYTWDALYNNGVNPAQGFFFQNLATKNYLSNADTALSIATDPIGTEGGQTDSDDNSSLKFQDYVWNYRDYNGYNQLAMYSDTARYIRYSVGGGNLKLGTTSTSTDVNNSNVYLYEKVDPAEYRWELADTLESNERYLVVSSNEAGNAKMMTNTLRTFGSKDIEVKADEDGTLYIDYDLVYGDTGIFNAYLIREGSFWFDNWQDNGYSCVTRLNSGSIGATSSHGDDSYYFRFNYVDNKLVAYSGLNGTATRTLAYNNGFTEGSGNGVYLYKLTEILPEPEPEPTSDLAIYLPFENATDNVSEDVAGEYDATLHSNATIGEGFKGNGLVLDGNGAYASLPAGTNLLMDEDYSFSVWVKMNVHENATHILDFGSSDSHYAYLAINYTGGTGPRYTIKYNGSTVGSVGPLDRVSLNEWHHFAVTYGDNTMKLYLDGVLMDTENCAYTAAGLGELANCWLGRSQFDVDPYLNGTIDEFKLYNDVLTAEEVAAEAAETGGPIYDEDMAIYLPFEEVDNNVSEDVVGEYDATLHSNAKIGEGFKGKGLVLDGNGAYASLPAGTNLLMDEDYSFSVWVKMNVHEDATHILDFGSSDSHYAYLAINYTGGRGPRYTIKYDGTTVGSVGPIDRVSLNEWHHFAVTYGDNTMKLYLDGVLMDTETCSYTAAGLGELANCWLGRSQFDVDPYLNGTIDEFKLYGDVLTAEEVAAEAAEKADPTPDPEPDPDPPVYETDENTLFLATDVHEYNQGVADVLGYINETVGVTPDNALFGGDFVFHITGNASQTETERAEIEATVNEVSPGTDTFFYQGNHDSVSAANMDKTGLATYNDHYVVYGINLSELPSTVNALRSFLASYEDNPNYAGKPLFVCSHCPLDETRRTDHAGGTATSYINLLNQYGDTIDIIFTFGHSHTEEFIDTFVPKGGTIDPENGIVGDKVELNFTYMNMGFITNKDYLYSAGTASDGTQHSSSLKSANYNPRTNSTGATAYEHVYGNRTDSAYTTVDAVFFWDVTSATLATVNEDQIIIKRYGYGADGTKENHPVKELATYTINRGPEPVVNEIISVNGKENGKATAYVNEDITLVFSAEAGATKAAIKGETGKWISRKSATVVDNGDGTETWTLVFSVGTKGERALTVSLDYGEGLVDTEMVAELTVTEPPVTGEPEFIEIVEAPGSAKAKANFTIKVKTNADVTKIGIFNENGAGISKTVVDKTIDVDGNVVWELSMSVNSSGTRMFAVKVLGTSDEWVDGGRFQIKIAKK